MSNAIFVRRIENTLAEVIIIPDILERIWQEYNREIVRVNGGEIQNNFCESIL